MDVGGAFCIVCSGPPPLTSGRICESCFRSRVHLSELPDRIQQTRCPKCDVDLIDGHWSRHPDDDLHRLRVQEALEVHAEADSLNLALLSETIDDRATRLYVQVSGTIEGIAFDDEHEAILQTSDGVCPTCTRRAGRYYEATMQLRSAGRRLDETEVKDLRATLDDVLGRSDSDPMFFITEEGAVQGGWDLLLGSKAMARLWAKHLATRFGGQVKESSKVIGHREGEDVSRLTVLYRKPAYALGDVVRFDGGLWRVDSWRKEGPILLSMNRLHRSSASWRDMERALVASRAREQVEVEILRADDSAIDILDQRDWQVRTIARPFDLPIDADRVRIALIDEEWVGLPRTKGESGSRGI